MRQAKKPSGQPTKANKKAKVKKPAPASGAGPAQDLSLYTEPGVTVAGVGRGRYLSGEQVQVTDVKWLIPDLVPDGVPVLLTGESESGKSHFLTALAASVSNGHALGNRFNSGDGKVLIFSPEENPNSQLVPRLKAHGAAIRNCKFPDYDNHQKALPRLVFPADLNKLRLIALDIGARLIIFDPLTAYLASSKEANDEIIVRAIIDGLQTVCSQADCSMFFTKHFRKSREGKGMDRVGGSAAWTQHPRFVLTCGTDPEASEKRVLAVSKNSLNGSKRSFYFDIKAEGKNGVFSLLEECQVTADELSVNSMAPADRDALTDAMAYLLETLKAGERAAKDVNRVASECGISIGTLRRAKVKLGVVSAQVSQNSEPYWVWRLPAEDQANIV